MKILFASDIHGSASAVERLLDRLEDEKADRWILLGDLLYHGPRNDLPERYDPKRVFSLLNETPISPLCVRGNCDAEIDQMVLRFPIMADYMLLPLTDTVAAFVTHGHLFGPECLPPHREGDVLIHGHTHVHGVWEEGDLVRINPGSSALPKEGQPCSYMTYENGTFIIKSLLDQSILMEYSLPSYSDYREVSKE